MRIAAIGDAHLGRTATTATTADGVNAREFDFERSFEAAIEAALATKPDLMVWLGDVFDHPRPQLPQLPGSHACTGHNSSAWDWFGGDIG